MNTWDAELEWFLCQADAQCGVGSNFMPTIRRIQVGMFSGTINPDPYTDSQVGLGSRKVRAFERERQAHRRWCKLSEHMRDIAVASAGEEGRGGRGVYLGGLVFRGLVGFPSRT